MIFSKSTKTYFVCTLFPMISRRCSEATLICKVTVSDTFGNISSWCQFLFIVSLSYVSKLHPDPDFITVKIKIIFLAFPLLQVKFYHTFSLKP